MSTLQKGAHFLFDISQEKSDINLMKITCSCGHEKTISNYMRDHMVLRNQRGLCPACSKARREKLVESKNDKMGLPQLDGSPKQISYAQSIRLNLLSSMKKFHKDMLERDYDGDHSKSNEIIDKDLHDFDICLKSITSAKIWIDNREDFCEILKYYDSFICVK